MRVDESGWKWMKYDEMEWKWVKVGESGWKWMKVGESGWKMVKAYIEKNEFCGGYGYLGKKKLAENLA